MKRRIIITGASSDIGAAIAVKIITPQDDSILQGNKNAGKTEGLRLRLGESCQMAAVDLSDEKALVNFCSEIGDADILVNAAACTVCDLLPNLSDEQIGEMIKVNILALTRICRAVVPSMVARRKGIIINISSVAARKSNRGQTVYAGTKGYVESFSKALAAEFGAKGLRVNCIAPGPINSGSLKGLMSYAADEVKQNIASARIGTPDDVANAAAFLCSEGASFINGSVIAIDGGFMKGI
jgi:3-oxoacyl-[acyl-carrier protein] reductase